MVVYIMCCDIAANIFANFKGEYGPTLFAKLKNTFRSQMDYKFESSLSSQ